MIRADKISFSYNRQLLFDNLSVKFLPGRIYGTLGKNGAGKTSLLKLLCGLLKPQKGHCSFLNKPSRNRTPDLLEQIYFIPESFYLPPITIAQYESLHSPFYHQFDPVLFHQHLNEMELKHSQKLNSLSYGLSKRFLLAFGLATNSRILLLDEPTNGLDIPSKRSFRKLLASSINEERTIIIATHQIKEMETLFDHLVFIDQGKILLSNSVPEIAMKLQFKNVTSFEENEAILYKEEIPGGYATISRNLTGEELPVDIEFLFSAVTGLAEQVIEELNP